MSTWAVIVLVVVIIAGLVMIAAAMAQRRRTARLRRRFGPEYDRLVSTKGDRRRAEAELEARLNRVRSMPLRELEPADRARFAEAWRAVQARFVDDPKRVVVQADGLIGETMRARGYSLGDYEQCVADLSVTHPRFVEHYRTAHEVALRTEGGRATTEELRQAMIDYRALFEDLLGKEIAGTAEVQRGRAA